MSERSIDAAGAAIGAADDGPAARPNCGVTPSSMRPTSSLSSALAEARRSARAERSLPTGSTLSPSDGGAGGSVLPRSALAVGDMSLSAPCAVGRARTGTYCR